MYSAGFVSVKVCWYWLFDHVFCYKVNKINFFFIDSDLEARRDVRKEEVNFT